MTRFFLPPIALSACVLSTALPLLPGGASAQLSRRDGWARSWPAGQPYSLSSAIETAGQSPFRVSGLVAGSAGARMLPGAATLVTAVGPRTGGRGVVMQEAGRDVETEACRRRWCSLQARLEPGWRTWRHGTSWECL